MDGLADGSQYGTVAGEPVSIASLALTTFVTQRSPHCSAGSTPECVALVRELATDEMLGRSGMEAIADSGDSACGAPVTSTP